MKYTVVHSNDPYMLARLATDLQMGGRPDFDFFQNPEWNPFEDDDTRYLRDYGDRGLMFFNHEGSHPCPIRHKLTSRNYIKVLTQILEP